jgi:hypothetical protein
VDPEPLGVETFDWSRNEVSAPAFGSEVRNKVSALAFGYGLKREFHYLNFN